MMKQNYTLLFGIILVGLISVSGCVQSTGNDNGYVKTTAPSLPIILVFSANQPISSEADARALFTSHASEIWDGMPGSYSSYYGNEGLELKLQSLKITDIPPKESVVYGRSVNETLGDRIGNITSEWAVQVSVAPIGKPFRESKDQGVYEYPAGKEYVHPDTGGLCAEAISSDGSPIPPSGCLERDYWQPALQFIYGISPNGEVVLSNAFELGLEEPIPGAQY